jgi:hypothetical protein
MEQEEEFKSPLVNKEENKFNESDVSSMLGSVTHSIGIGS